METENLCVWKIDLFRFLYRRIIDGTDCYKILSQHRVLGFCMAQSCYEHGQNFSFVP